MDYLALYDGLDKQEVMNKNMHNGQIDTQEEKKCRYYLKKPIRLKISAEQDKIIVGTRKISAEQRAIIKQLSVIKAMLENKSQE